MVLLARQVMLKRFAFVLALCVIVTGVVFIALDILDIAEDFRLYISIPVLDTVFICLVAIIVVYLSTRNYATSGSWEMLGIGCAVLAFGFASLLHSWMKIEPDYNARITANDTGILIAGICHLGGGILATRRWATMLHDIGARRNILIISYLAIFLVISLVAWMAFHNIITFYIRSLTDYLAGRDVIQGIAALLCMAAAIIYLRMYLKSNSVFYLWYVLGLVLFTAGYLFISRGFLESRIAWLGRTSEYIAGFYFLASVLYYRRQARTGGEVTK